VGRKGAGPSRFVSDDEDLVRKRYELRDMQGDGGIYDDAHPEVRMQVAERQRLVTDFLRRRGVEDRSQLRILDVGCGSGRELQRWKQSGVDSLNLHGIDLVESRVAEAQARLKAADMRVGSAQSLPWESGSFDIVCQYMAFSSMPSSQSRQDAAAEIARVVSPTGFILWYDFWINPFNHETTRMGLKEIRRLFPAFVLETHRVTLAPPLARLIAPRALFLSRWLNHIPALRSHHLVFLFRPSG
jgi:ubiquinone/menaquinone biosynthesis C-methylase UbiE